VSGRSIAVPPPPPPAGGGCDNLFTVGGGDPSIAVPPPPPLGLGGAYMVAGLGWGKQRTCATSLSIGVLQFKICFFHPYGLWDNLVV